MVDQIQCPECHGVNLRKAGTVFRKIENKRTKVRQMQCKDCGFVFTPKPYMVDNKNIKEF